MYIGNQLAKIHIGKKSLRLSDDEYRDFLFGITGKRSSKDMDVSQRASVISKMTNMGAFKHQKRSLSKQEKACVAKWYKLRALGAVKSKDKSSLNTYIKNHFEKKNIFALTDAEQRKLLGMLQGWIDSIEHKVEKNKHIFNR